MLVRAGEHAWRIVTATMIGSGARLFEKATGAIREQAS
jgi:hypothetical protein